MYASKVEGNRSGRSDSGSADLLVPDNDTKITPIYPIVSVLQTIVTAR